MKGNKGKYIHSAVHLLIYSVSTLLRGILLLPGSRRRKTNGGQGPQEAQSVERRTQSQKGRVRVGIKSAKSRGSTEKAPLTQPGEGDNGGAPVVVERVKLLGWQRIGKLSQLVPQSRRHGVTRFPTEVVEEPCAECTMLPGAPPLPAAAAPPPATECPIRADCYSSARPKSHDFCSYNSAVKIFLTS